MINSDKGVVEEVLVDDILKENNLECDDSDEVVNETQGFLNNFMIILDFISANLNRNYALR